MKRSDSDVPERGKREAPTQEEARVFSEAAREAGAPRGLPAEARRFQKAAAAELSVPPAADAALPRWVLAMVEKRVSPKEFARTVAERTMRAPSKENQKLALLLSNEISRMEGGAEAIEHELTPELLDRVTGRGRQAR